MHVTFSTQDIFSGKYEGIMLFTYEERSDAEATFATKFGKNLPVARERKEFEGKANQMHTHIEPGMPRFCILVGLGKRAELTTVKLREAAGLGAMRMRDLGAKTVAIELPQELDAQEVAQAVTEGAVLATYRFTKYKTQKLDEIRAIDTLTIVSDRTGMAPKTGVEIGSTIAETCNLVRDLQNMMPAELTPPVLAGHAARLAKNERIDVRVLDRKQLEKQGFGGIVSVGKGSESEPRLVTLEYAPKGAKKTIALVGKGITFDTGGISIKPADRMHDMKFDMSGAASVIGVVRNASKLKLPVRVIGVLALAENMPSGSAYRPGDIVTTKSGKTIEIQNTDAEGRVVLADALTHAASFKPDMIIDVATLTGAVVVALGDLAAGALGNDQAAIDEVISASRRCGERVWQLPLWEEYDKDIESQVADMKNVGVPRVAGTIAGAALLKQFVGDTPWVHLDIAGVAWADVRDRYFTRRGEGGTAFGVRLLTELLRGMSPNR